MVYASSEVKIQQNLNFQKESKEIIGIYEHGLFSSDSIEKEVITTKKSEFYFTIGYNKQEK